MDDLEFNDSSTELQFAKASKYLQGLAATLQSGKLLEFYGLYKQATEGPCNTSKPGFFDFKGKQKWEAWKALGDMEKEEAMEEYAKVMDDLDPEWELKAEADGTGGGAWVRVSRMAETEQDDEDSTDKTVFDWVKENNLEELKKLDAMTLHIKDDNGMTPLHWAADRGHAEVAKFLLLSCGPEVDACDADGQTALHYAASCGHAAVIRVLLDGGADASIQDADGLKAYECTDSQDIKQLFS